MGSPSKGSKQREKEREERRLTKKRKREERRAPDGRHERSVAKREERRRFLIVCEGEKTEPNYFEKFPVDKLVHIKIKGCGKHTIFLVEEAIQIRDKAPTKRAFDETWVVFDRDSFDRSDFDDALQLAKREKIYTAYTNEAFELWFLLHFNYSEASLSRKTYKDRLTKALGKEYLKNDDAMYSRLRRHQPIAIQNAIKLWAKYEGSHNPEKDNPCTSVHLLVCRLNRQRRGPLPAEDCWCGLDNKLCLGPNPEEMLCRAT